MYKKKLILLLLLFPFYARSMQRQMVPYDRHFNQNNDTNDSQDTQSKIIALDNQVVFLKKELAESNNKLNRALRVVANLYQEQEAKKVGKAEKKAERDAQYKEVQEKREQEARKAWYARLNNLIPAYLPVATSAAGYAAGSVVAKNMYNSVCPEVVKNAPLINTTLQAGVEACGGKAGAAITKLVINNAPKTFEECAKKYGNFLLDVERAEWRMDHGSFLNPKSWLIYSTATVKHNIPHAQVALIGTHLFLVLTSCLHKKLQSKQSSNAISS